MMVCHLIPNEKFTEKVVDFLSTQYDINMNQFIIYYEGKDFGIFDNTNIVNVESIVDETRRVLPILKDADKIVIHGFGANQIIEFFNKHIELMKKAVVIIWGGDLYNDYFFLKEHNKHLCLRLRWSIHKKKSMIKKAPYFMTFTYTDYERAHKWLGANGIQFDCLYPSNLDMNDLKKIEKKNNVNHFETNILVGNSATPTNNHFEAFEKLKRFSNNSIKIYCPLSYGDTEYGKRVEREGKRIFGDKFIAIKEYMSIDKYSEFLSQMDLALFIYDRQQATANLEILSYFGAKIYLKRTCALWEHYVERDGCIFYPFDEIDRLSYTELCDFGQKEKSINKKYFEKIWDVSYIKSLWDKVLYYE